MRQPDHITAESRASCGDIGCSSCPPAPSRKVADVTLPAALIALLREPSLSFIATNMPDGSPQLTQVWVDTDGEHVVVNSVKTHQKVRNLKRDPRVAVTIADPADPSNYFQVRGRVLRMTTDGAV